MINTVSFRCLKLLVVKSFENLATAVAGRFALLFATALSFVYKASET